MASFGPGSFYLNPPESLHYVWCVEDSELQLTGMGPWEVHFQGSRGAGGEYRYWRPHVGGTGYIKGSRWSQGHLRPARAGDPCQASTGCYRGRSSPAGSAHDRRSGGGGRVLRAERVPDRPRCCSRNANARARSPSGGSAFPAAHPAVRGLHPCSPGPWPRRASSRHDHPLVVSFLYLL